MSRLLLNFYYTFIFPYLFYANAIMNVKKIFRDNKATPYELKSGDVNSVKNSKINCNKQTKVVIHGWQNNFESESVQMIKDGKTFNTK